MSIKRINRAIFSLVGLVVLNLDARDYVHNDGTIYKNGCARCHKDYDKSSKYDNRDRYQKDDYFNSGKYPHNEDKSRYDEYGNNNDRYDNRYENRDRYDNRYDDYPKKDKFDNNSNKISLFIHGGEIKFMNDFGEYEEMRLTLKNGQSQRLTFKNFDGKKSYTKNATIKYEDDGIYFDTRRVADVDRRARFDSVTIDLRSNTFNVRDMILDIKRLE